MLGRQLQRVDHADNLVEVPSRRRRIVHGQLHLLVRPDHKHAPHRKGVRRVRVNHPVQVRNRPVRVRDQREVQRRSLRLLNVLRPRLMRRQLVHAQPQHLHAALVELRLQLRRVPQLGRAHRGKVLRVREQDRPVALDVVIKMDLAFGRFRREIRRDIANL